MTYTDAERKTLEAALAVMQMRGHQAAALRLRRVLDEPGVFFPDERVRIQPTAKVKDHAGSAGTVLSFSGGEGVYIVAADYGLSVPVSGRDLARLPHFFPGDRVTSSGDGRIIDGNIVTSSDTGYEGLIGEIISHENLGNYKVRAADGREHEIFAGHLRLADKEA